LTKANNSPKVAKPSKNNAGIQMISDIDGTPLGISYFTYAIAPGARKPKKFSQALPSSSTMEKGCFDHCCQGRSLQCMPTSFVGKNHAANER
jgi:hypothetical protein